MTKAIDKPPAWVRDAVFYQIFPDRFAKSAALEKPQGLEPWADPPTFNGYKGGDLLGICESLDWLTDLGINAIYLNPIFQSGANHRYHTHDYLLVDPLLGGNEAFDTLLSRCHQRGIRVMLDGVFNHASRGFFYFHDVLENGPSSPWADWFVIHDWPLHPYDADKPANYEAWWGLKALPKFNTDNPQVREYLMLANTGRTRGSTAGVSTCQRRSRRLGSGRSSASESRRSTRTSTSSARSGETRPRPCLTEPSSMQR